jgi:hypothetical protein
MPQHRCNHCLKALPTAAGIKKHLALAGSCKKKWQEQVERTAVNVFDSRDDEQEESTEPMDRMEPSDGEESHDDEWESMPGPADDFVPPPRPRSPESDSDESNSRRKRTRVTVEEVDDEDDPKGGRYTEGQDSIIAVPW